MLGGLLLNLFEEIMGYPYGGQATPKYEWIKSQAERDKLLRDDEDILTFVTTLVTSDMING